MQVEKSPVQVRRNEGKAGRWGMPRCPKNPELELGLQSLWQILAKEGQSPFHLSFVL
jgi:hypothetical protein